MLKNLLSEKELTRRLHSKTEDVRGAYFRDTTAIIHSYPYRRLKHKTQVFFSPSNDHICTRIEHVLHVSTIAAAICKGLGIDSELASAIGMGHDLGHAPFGHVGERVLNEMMQNIGGFKHELYSLRVVDHLAYYGKGLNLTYAVRDGIVNHCGESFQQSLTPDFTVKELEELTDRGARPSTWEGTVVRYADSIAYLGRDFEDAVKLKLIKRSELPAQAAKLLGKDNGEIISTLVHDVIDYTQRHAAVGLSEKVFEAVLELKTFNYNRIYNSPELADFHTYFHRILTTIAEYLQSIFSEYGYEIESYKQERNLLAVRFGNYLRKMQPFYQQRGEDSSMIISDYVAGMSDSYALACVTEIMTPKRMEDQFNRFVVE
ncbi:MAG: deoxyguanosinetriphosphate triphosphohydrolase family protein [Spirochaetota bacterium]